MARARSVSSDRVVGHRARDSMHRSRLSHSPVGSSQRSEAELQAVVRARAKSASPVNPKNRDTSNRDTSQISTEVDEVEQSELPNFEDQTADNRNTDPQPQASSQFGGGSQ